MIIEQELSVNLAEETRKRLEKMRMEFTEPPKLKVFENTEHYDQMIAQVQIPVSALCEHHEVAFQGFVNIAYIPKDWLVGLSKMARIAEHFFNPTVKTLQERGTQQILNCIEENLKPLGTMVVVKARHGCVEYRGVKKPSITITSAVAGVFRDVEKGARNEFLQLIK